MPNYGYSTPYQGMSGGALPSGSMEALTAPGRNIARGIEKFGDNVWGLVAQYQKNKAERELASGELEGLISQFVPRREGPPTGESGGPDVDFLAKMVGEKNVKKFVEGKATTSDMLAMTHSIKTAQAQKDQDLARQIQEMQLDNLKRQQFQDIQKLNQQQAVTDSVKFALENQNEPAPENLHVIDPVTGKEDPTKVGVAPIPYEKARTDLAQFMAQRGVAPESFAALDSILSLAGKTAPMKVAVQQLPGNLGAVVQAGGKTEIVKPEKVDPSIQARTIIGFQGLAPTEKEAIDFRTLKASTDESQALADKLIELGKTPGSKISPKLRAKGRALSQQLAGAIRVGVLGPGTVNDNERKILEDMAANPATIFSMNSKSFAALETLKESLGRKVIESAKVLGLSPSSENQTTGGSVPMWDPVTRKFK